MRVRRAVLLLPLVSVMAAVAGCSGNDPEPQSLPTLSPGTTSTPTPTDSPTATPTGIAAPTPEGAGAFARFWYSEITRAWSERDPAIIARLSAPGCTACEKYVRSITGARDRGERVEGVIFTLKLVEAQGIVDGKTRVAIIYDGPATKRYDRSGKLIMSEPAVTNFQQELRLVRHSAGWRVQEDASV